jgi:hypothetical protein
MSYTQNQIFNVLNMYPFVNTEVKKTDIGYINMRLNEYKLMNKQREAVSFCKTLADVNTNDLSKISNVEKEKIEKCLKENYLNKNPDYFGKRDVIFLDLYSYDSI